MKSRFLVVLCLVLGSLHFLDAQQTITTVAGNGNATFGGDGGPPGNASLDSPAGLAIDAEGNVYICDAGHQRIRRVDRSTGTISTFAGTGGFGFSGDGGPATAATFRDPVGLAVDARGNLYIADQGNSRVRKIDAVTKIITTVAGTATSGFSGDGGPATAAMISSPMGVACDSGGNLYFSGSQRVRRVAASTGIITTVAGNGDAGFGGDGGPATAGRLFNPFGVAIDGMGNLLIADGTNNRIR